MVSNIWDEELEERVKDLEIYLVAINKGDGPQERLNLYNKGGRDRLDLDANCPMGKFRDEQHDLVSSTLMVMFGHSGAYSADYICKVLFPEALIKIYMDTQGCQYKQAEEELFNINLSQVSYMC